MNQPTFIQKYKPYYIDDFFLKSEQKTVLKTLIGSNSLNLLLIGDVATGKTTFLYALIREYYGLSRSDRFSTHDVLFINNLKEQQGISYFRNEMKTFCQTLSHTKSQQSVAYAEEGNKEGKEGNKGRERRKKMIIIDDIDTIHQQCQQVLCNYMDKYKHNIHFIFSCNNVQKVIENIQSRMHIVRMGLPEPHHLTDLYDRIVAEEELQDRIVDPDAVRDYVLSISHHNLRELVNIMEKIMVYFGSTKETKEKGKGNKGKEEGKDEITEAACRALFLTRIHQSFHDYIVLLQKGDLKGGIAIMYSVVDNGYSIVDIFDSFFKYLKTCDLLNETEKYEVVKVLCDYITIIHNVHEETIEMVLFTNKLGNLLFP